MTYLVAFDGRPGSDSVLRRAAALATETDERLVVVSVLPTDRALAERYGLLEDGGYDPEAAAERLRSAAAAVAPAAAFRAQRVDAYAGKGQIADEIGRVAREEDADVVFVGTDDPGRVVGPVSCVDDGIDDPGYDVFVVRSTSRQ